MLGLLDALDVERAHVVGQLARRRLRAAHGARTAGARRPLVLMGPGGIGISQSQPTDGLKRLLGYYAGEGPRSRSCAPSSARTWSSTAARSTSVLQRALRVQHRSRGGRQPAAARAQGSRRLQAPGLPARSAPADAGQPDAGAVGHRRPRQPARRRRRAAARCRRATSAVQPHRPLGAVGARGRIQRLRRRLPGADGPDRGARP